MTETTTLKVTVLQLNAAAVSRNAAELASWEVDAAKAWREAEVEARNEVRLIVRAALFRLLTSSNWLPGAVKVSAGGRLDIRLTIQLDTDVERSLALSRAELIEQRQETRRQLLALADELAHDLAHEEEVSGA